MLLSCADHPMAITDLGGRPSCFPFHIFFGKIDQIVGLCSSASVSSEKFWILYCYVENNVHSFTKKLLYFALQHVQEDVEIMKSVTMELASAPKGMLVMARITIVCKV